MNVSHWDMNYGIRTKLESVSQMCYTDKYTTNTT